MKIAVWRMTELERAIKLVFRSDELRIKMEIAILRMMFK